MATASPLWPASLHHIEITSDQPPILIDFYQRVFQSPVEEAAEGRWHLPGHGRHMLIGRGPRNGLGFSAFAIEDSSRLEALRAHALALGMTPLPSPSPLFDSSAFALADPDGNRLVFGTPIQHASSPAPLPGRLQHSVVGSASVEALTRWRLDLGFVLSDEVKDDDGALTATFMRSDDEHHSQAVFRTRTPRFDHYALESTCWNDIRDWADHLGSLRLPLSWGPGRHGPGNNLFFMICDADGNMVEISAEIESMPRDMPARLWKHEPHTLNLWGTAWMRS